MTRPSLLPLLLLSAVAATQEPAAEAAPPATIVLTGRVITPEGAPVVGAALACAPRDALATADLLAAPDAATGADGTYSLRARPPVADRGPLYLHVAANGRASVVREIAWRREGEADNPIVAQDFGDVVLIRGQQLIGRVRDAEGRPLAAVRVLAQDLLEQSSAFRSAELHGFRCSARSDASGIFRLPGALPCGTVLEFACEGYGRQWLQPVAFGTPLEVELRATGWVQGRVLDGEGRGVAGATVGIDFELASVEVPVTTGADGSFRLPLDRPGRWRLSASAGSGPGAATGRTAVFSGPRANLEVVLEPPEEAEEQPTFEVRAVTRDGGNALDRFRAVALWEDYSNRNLSYREYRLHHLLRQAEPTANGTATVAAPSRHQPRTGVVRVVAEGFAPGTVDGLEWREPEDGPPAPVVVTLDPEATLTGIVRDGQSGEPVAGARVAVAQKPRLGETYYGNQQQLAFVATRADGSFHLRGLGEGTWQLLVSTDDHPEGPPVDVDLGRGEQRQGFEVTLPSGAAVRGRLTGLAIAPGTRAFLAPVATPRFGPSAGAYYGGRALTSPAQRAVPVATDGTFAITGVARGNHVLVVKLPGVPRCGGDLYLPIEPFRVRGVDIDRAFDCSEDRPGLLRGRITFARAAAPYDRLLVVAAPAADSRQPIAINFNAKVRPGPRVFVERDGTFALPLVPGHYRLTVLDLATAVALHEDLTATELEPGATAERAIELQLVEVALKLQPADDVTEMAAVERIEVRFVPATIETPPAGFFGGEQYDSRTGLHWGSGTTRKSIVLPEGKVLLLCRNELGQIRVDSRRWQNDPLGRAELEVSLANGPQQECAIAISGPPEIPGAGDGGGADADADGEVRKQ